MFVALVVMALATSLVSGPAMKCLLYREEPDEDVVTLLRRGAFVSELHAHTPSEAIAELVRALGSLLTGMKRRRPRRGARARARRRDGPGRRGGHPARRRRGPRAAAARARPLDAGHRLRRARRPPRALRLPPAHPARRPTTRRCASWRRSRGPPTTRGHATSSSPANGIDEVTRVLSESAKRTRESMRPPASQRKKRRPVG